MKIFESTAQGVKINDVAKAVEVINDNRYRNDKFDICPESLREFVSSFDGDVGLENMNCYYLGHFQGLKHGISYLEQKIKKEIDLLRKQGADSIKLIDLIDFLEK